MYNAEQKRAFIKDTFTNAGQRDKAVYVFTALEPSEVQKGKDFCTWKKGEILPVVTEVISARTGNQRSRLIILYKYIDWCVANSIEGTSTEIRLIESFGSDKLRRQTVASPRHLQRYLNIICAPEDWQTNDNVFRCYFWLAYAGIRQSDVMNIKNSNVDLNKMLVSYGGREYQIYEEARAAFENCTKLEAFQKISLKPNGVRSQTKRADGDTILRLGAKGDPSRMFRRLQTEMSKKCGERGFANEADKEDDSLDLDISYARVVLSGIFYRMYIAETQGVRVDFVEAAGVMLEGKTDNVYRINRAAKEYEMDYARWKVVYEDDLRKKY